MFNDKTLHIFNRDNVIFFLNSSVKINIISNKLVLYPSSGRTVIHEEFIVKLCYICVENIKYHNT